MAAFTLAVSKSILFVLPNMPKQIVSSYQPDINQKLLYPILIEHLKDTSNGYHFQMIKRITENSSITDSDKLNIIKCLFEQLN